MTKTSILRASIVLGVLALSVSVGSRADAHQSTTSSRHSVTMTASAKTAIKATDKLAQDDTVTMTLLHNNDGESKLLPDPESGFPGIARFTQTLQDLGIATEADILLRVTSGDNFLASKELSTSLARDGQPLYDSIALSGLYEAMGLGNHDFDFGPEVTARFIAGFVPQVPFLAANIDVSGEPELQALADSGSIASSVVVTDPTSGLDVGVIGAITPRLPNICSPRFVVVDSDVAAVVNAEVEALVAQGVDRIVLLSHLQGLPQDQALVPQLSGVDIVVAGGGGELLKNPGDSCMSDEDAFAGYPLVLTDLDGNDVPVVTAPGGYRCIGQLDVTFGADGQLVDWTGTSIGIALDAQPEDFVVENVEIPLTEALADLDAAVIGASDVELDGRRNSVRTASSNIGTLLADAMLEAGQAGPDFGGAAADVAIQNGGGIRNDAVIPAGDLTAADTFDIAPFANFVVTVEVPRDRFKDLLEVGVSGLPDAEGSFPQIAGFTMDVDPAQPAREIDGDGDCALIGDQGSRVRNVTLDDGTVIVDGGEVVAGDDLVLATINFLANGGDCYPLDDLEFTALGVSYQQALESFIVDTLGGRVSADDYGADASRTSIGATDESDSGDQTDSGDTGGDDEAEVPDNLPNTGIGSWPYLIAAFTVAAGGAMVIAEARRASRVSLANRLDATRAWSPGRKRNT